MHRFDLSKRKADVVVGGVKSFQVSFTGEKMLYQQDDKWTIAEPPPMPDGPDGPPPKPGNEKTLKTQDLEVKVDPPAEWKQMFHEVWRIERDFFYDPHYHGLDLQAAEERYGVYLSGLASRDDLNYLFTEMLGNMTVGHMFLGGGDRPEVKHVRTGLLGADYKIENGRYRFARVYNGENWNPGSEGAADAAGRQRDRGRISAGGEWPGSARHRQRLQLLRRDRRQDHAAEGGAGSDGRRMRAR